jgi:hypothetical protein
MVAEFDLLSLFQQRSSQALLNCFGEHHARQSNRWLLHREEVSDFSLRLEDDNGASPVLHLRVASARLVHEITNLFGDLGVAEPCFPCSHLHCNRKKLGFVALDVSPQKSDEMARSTHIGRVSGISAAGKQKCIPELFCMSWICCKEERNAAIGWAMVSRTLTIKSLRASEMYVVRLPPARISAYFRSEVNRSLVAGEKLPRCLVGENPRNFSLPASLVAFVMPAVESATIPSHGKISELSEQVVAQSAGGADLGLLRLTQVLPVHGSRWETRCPR